MTLAKFGLQYKNWSNAQLRAYAKERGIELPRTHRKLWIRLLREKDGKSTLPFLEFPPEIRNMVYELLLTPKYNAEQAGLRKCYAAILATCKQVNTEAADLLAMQYESICVPLRITLCNHAWNIRDSSYHVEVRLNDTLLGQGRDMNRNIEVEWPQSLAKLRSIKIDIRLGHFRRDLDSTLTDLKHHALVEAGEAQVNHTLYDLNTVLKRENNLQQLDTDIFSGLQWSMRYQEDLLWPICIISGMAENSDIRGKMSQTYFNTDPGPFMLHAAAAFRTLRDLEQEAELQCELRDNLLLHHSITAGNSQLPQYCPCDDALKRCRIVTSVRQNWGLYVFAGYDELAVAISFIEHHLDQTENEKIGGGSSEVAEKVKLLKKNRAAKKMDTASGT